MLELSSLDLEDIAAALADQTDYEHRWLLNPESGEIVFWTSETGIDGQRAVDLDEWDLLCIEPLPLYIGYQDMAEFAAQISDERAGRRLAGLSRAKAPSAGSKPNCTRSFRTYFLRGTPSATPAPTAARSSGSPTNSLITDAAAARFLDQHPEPGVP